MIHDNIYYFCYCIIREDEARLVTIATASVHAVYVA